MKKVFTAALFGHLAMISGQTAVFAKPGDTIWVGHKITVSAMHRKTKSAIVFNDNDGCNVVEVRQNSQTGARESLTRPCSAKEMKKN